jgi:hypothetical protein
MITWLRKITAASRIVFRNRAYAWVLALAWLITLTLFLLISRSSVIVYMLLSNQFSVATKLSFMWSVYRNYFTYLASPIVFTAFVFTLLAALNITLLIYMARALQQRGSRAGSAGAAGAVIVSHVLSCGSSLLAPFFSALAGSSAYNDPGRYAVAAGFGTILNIVGLILILRSTSGVAAHILHARGYLMNDRIRA